MWEKTEVSGSSFSSSNSPFVLLLTSVLLWYVHEIYFDNGGGKNGNVRSWCQKLTTWQGTSNLGKQWGRANTCRWWQGTGTSCRQPLNRAAAWQGAVTSTGQRGGTVTHADNCEPLWPLAEDGEILQPLAGVNNAVWPRAGNPPALLTRPPQSAPLSWSPSSSYPSLLCHKLHHNLLHHDLLRHDLLCHDCIAFKQYLVFG